MRPTTVAGSVPLLTDRCPVRPSSIVRSVSVLLSDATHERRQVPGPRVRVHALRSRRRFTGSHARALVRNAAPILNMCIAVCQTAAFCPLHTYRNINKYSSTFRTSPAPPLH